MARLTQGRLTKEELERIRTARKGRLIAPTKSRKVGRAVIGILSALVPPEAMVGAEHYEEKKTGRGRGRPPKTYKERWVPGIGKVKVPTHIYRKMMSKAKADRRLAEARRQAGIQEQYEAEQLATVQRQAYEQPDSFNESTDMDHEAQVASIREQQAYRQQVAQQPRPSRFQQVGRGINRVGQGVNNLMNQMRQRQFEQQQRIAQRQQAGGQQYPPEFAQQAGGQQAPNIPSQSLLGNKSRILSAPNVFNNPSRNRNNNW